jgi:hypothetical protein
MKLRRDRLTQRRMSAVQRISAVVDRYRRTITELQKSELNSSSVSLIRLESKIASHLTTIANTKRNLGMRSEESFRYFFGI